VEKSGSSLWELPDIHYPLFLPLKPYGLKSGEIEALSSYMCRQAEILREWPQPMTQRLIRNNYESKGLTQNTRYPALGMHSCNGIRTMANNLTSKMNETFEGEFDFKYLSLIPLQYLTDHNCRGLARRNKAWCPECWRSDIALERTPYMRLYWTMDLVSICCIHNCRLSEYCPCCGEVNNQFPKISRQWFCDNCGADLTTEPIDDRIGNFKSEEGWVSHSLFNLIEKVYSNKLTISPPTISKALSHLLNTHKLNSSEFSERLNISKKMIDALLTENHRPYFPALLDMCYRLDIPPDQLLFSRDNLTDQGMWLNIDKQVFVQSSQITEKDRKKVFSALKRIIKENPIPPVRVSHIAKKYEIRYSALNYHFPNEYRILRKRWSDWEANDRRYIHTVRLENLCHAVLGLVKNGVYPSDRRLRDLGLVKPSDLRREDVISVLRTFQDIYSGLDTGLAV